MVNATPAFVLLAGAGAVVLSGLLAGAVAYVIDRRKETRDLDDWFRRAKYDAYLGFISEMAKLSILRSGVDEGEPWKYPGLWDEFNATSEACMFLIDSEELQQDFGDLRTDFLFVLQADFDIDAINDIAHEIRTLLRLDLRPPTRSLMKVLRKRESREGHTEGDEEELA